jgi:hypothetical protein
MPSSPSDWSRTTCDHMAQRPALSASSTCMSAGDGGTIGPKIRRRERKMQRFKRSLCAEISLNPRRRLQHLQRPTPSHISSIALRASRRGVDYVARGCCGRLKFAHESRFASSFHNVTAPDRVQAVGFGAAAPRVTKMLVGSTTLLITPCAVRARPQVQGRAQQCASIK